VMRNFFVILFAFVAFSCTTTEAVSRQVMKRAAFDLNCSEEEISVQQLQGSAEVATYGVRGCGKRISYNAMCSSLGSNCVIDADLSSPEASP
jgi:hypothetical protein